MRTLILASLLLAACPGDDDGSDCKPGQRGFFCSGPDIDAAPPDADPFCNLLGYTPPVNCPDVELTVCRFNHNGYAYVCQEGVVTEQSDYFVDFCVCGTEERICRTSPGDPQPVHTCAVGCNPEDSTAHVDEFGNPFDPDTLCLHPDAGPPDASPAP